MSAFEIKPGDVLFVWDGGIIEKIIEGVTHGGPSHCALFLSPTLLEEAQGGRTIGDVDLSHYTSKSGVRLEVWGDDTLIDDERTEMVKFAHTLYGDGYDYVLIPLELAHFTLGLPLGWYKRRDEFICSNDIDTIAQHVGRRWSRVPNPAPVDLMTGGVLKFKGALGEWQRNIQKASA